jgi:hypothetical protein
MGNSAYFTQLNVRSSISETIFNKVANSSESDWKRILEQNIFKLDISDFQQDPEIYELINHFNCQDRLSVFKMGAHCSYDWHGDAIRGAAFNMLLNSFDSMCIFGVPGKYRSHSDIDKLQYSPNTYFLMDVSKHHCVMNFGEDRYVISIGVPAGSYEQVKDYLITHNLA